MEPRGKFQDPKIMRNKRGINLERKRDIQRKIQSLQMRISKFVTLVQQLKAKNMIMELLKKSFRPSHHQIFATRQGIIDAGQI